MIIGSQRPTVGAVWHHAHRAAPAFGGHRRVTGTAPRAVWGGGPAPLVKGGDTPSRRCPVEGNASPYAAPAAPPR